jgi:hypothetical protein
MVLLLQGRLMFPPRGDKQSAPCPETGKQKRNHDGPAPALRSGCPLFRPNIFWALRDYRRAFDRNLFWRHETAPNLAFLVRLIC